MNRHQRALENLEQTSQFLRTVEIGERAGSPIDMETGRFPMVLATEGEASDGHILSIRGVETKDRMPLLFGHRSTDAVPVLGSVVEPMKSRKDGIAVLRQTGIFNLEGDGPLSALRRDLAQLVNDDDLNAVSFRWDSLKYERRINLANDHSAYVDGAKVGHDDERYWGAFISKSRALEGSLVAIGSDPKALIGRSQNTEDKFSAVFLRALAARVDEESGLADLSAGFEAVTEAFGRLENLGVSRDEVALCLTNEAAEVSLYGGFMVPTSLAAQLRERDELILDRLPLVLERSAVEVETDAEEASDLSPEGGDDGERDDAPRYEEGSLGAMDAEDFFTGVRGAMNEAVGGTLRRVLGRR